MEASSKPTCLLIGVVYGVPTASRTVEHSEGKGWLELGWGGTEFQTN